MLRGREQTSVRPVNPTGCRDKYCSVQKQSTTGRGASGDFWDYWMGKGLKVPERPYAVLDADHPEGGAIYDDMENMCPVFREKLVPNYDVGVGIATGAMIFSYMLDRHGLPMLIVKQHADHSTLDGEATWEPVDTIDRKAIRGKNVLVVDIDVLTGKTVKRAADELRKFKPKKLDLFLRVGPIREPNYRNLIFDPQEYEDYHRSDGLDMRTRIPQGPKGFDNVLFFNELREPQVEKGPEENGALATQD